MFGSTLIKYGGYMYEQSREQELYQFTARQRRGMEETTQNTDNTQSEHEEDYYLEGGEELNFG